ncbi:hypothetical protein B0H19DRAFT_1234265 [Mycena capillaripes]|nr:hypothetical protein B0H19DRAFT_1234265 [Mycena capillaripes]
MDGTVKWDLLKRRWEFHFHFIAGLFLKYQVMTRGPNTQLMKPVWHIWQGRFGILGIPEIKTSASWPIFQQRVCGEPPVATRWLLRHAVPVAPQMTCITPKMSQRKPPGQPPDDVALRNRGGATRHRMPWEPPGGYRWLTANSLLAMAINHQSIFVTREGIVYFVLFVSPRGSAGLHLVAIFRALKYGHFIRSHHQSRSSFFALLMVLPITAPALLKARGAGGAGFAILGIFDLNLPWGQNCWNTRAVQFGSGLPPPLPVRSRTWNSLNRTANLEVHFHPVSALSTCFGTRPALVFSACFRPWNSLSGTANPFAHLYRISGSALGPAAGSKRVQCVFWHLLRSSVSSRASAPAIPLAAPLIPSHTPIASPLRLWAPQPAPRTCSARLALDPPPFSRVLPPARFLHRYH